MGTLLRWNHYSPLQVAEYEEMKNQMGLQRYPLHDVTFVMRLTSNY